MDRRDIIKGLVSLVVAPLPPPQAKLYPSMDLHGLHQLESSSGMIFYLNYRYDSMRDAEASCLPENCTKEITIPFDELKKLPI